MQAKYRLPVFSLFASVSTAQVYIGDVVLIADTFGHDAVTQLTSLSAGGQGACGFSFDSIDSGVLSTRIGAVNIAELYSLFVVAEGTAFNAAYVSSHAAVANNTGALPSYTIPFDGQPVLFAYWDDRATFSGIGAWGEVDDSDLYGWMRVGFSLGTDPDTFESVVSWTILDSATARGGGILAGTYTQIPEPGTSALLLSAAALAVSVAARRRHSTFARS